MTSGTEDPIAYERHLAGLDFDEQFERDNDEFCAAENQIAKAGPWDLILMWESGNNISGKPMSPVEWGALAGVWSDTFGKRMPSQPESGASATAEEPPATTHRDHHDDTMLDMHDVIRMTGLSESTLKRRWKTGEFPVPIKLSIRRMGWRTSTVKEWLASREASGSRH